MASTTIHQNSSDTQGMEYQSKSGVVEDLDIGVPFLTDELQKEIDLAREENHGLPLTVNKYSEEVERDNAKAVKQNAIKDFRTTYTYTSRTSNNEDQITFILSDGSRLSSKASSSGIIWVAVGGIDSICLVTLKKLDKKCVGGTFYVHQCKNTIIRCLMETIIYEIEGGSFKEINTSNREPFGIVSVIPGTNKDEASGSEALGDVYDENAAIEFLSKTIKSHSVRFREEIIEAAIGALYHMCFEKIKAKDIFVIVLDAGGAGYAQRYGGCDKIYEIKNHLSVLRKKAKKSRKIAEKQIQKQKQKQAAGVAEDMLKQLSPSDLNNH